MISEPVQKQLVDFYMNLPCFNMLYIDGIAFRCIGTQPIGKLYLGNMQDQEGKSHWFVRMIFPNNLTVVCMEFTKDSQVDFEYLKSYVS